MRNQLFGKVVGPVIVGAVGKCDWQAIGMVPGPDKMVTRGLGGRVGALGIVGGVLKKIPVVPEAAEDLVCRDVVEERAFLAAPVRTGGLEEGEGPVDIGGDKITGPVDRAVDVGLGGKVDNAVHIIFGHDFVYGIALPDVGTLEDVALGSVGLFDVTEREGVAGIGQGIDIDDPSGKLLFVENVADEVPSDKTGATGHHDCLEAAHIDSSVVWELGDYIAIPKKV